MTNIARYAKAVAAFLIAGLTALGTALVDDAVSRGEWVAVIVAALSTTGAVYAVPNKTDSVRTALDSSAQYDPGSTPGGGGAAGAVRVGLAWFIVLVVLAIFGLLYVLART